MSGQARSIQGHRCFWKFVLIVCSLLINIGVVRAQTVIATVGTGLYPYQLAVNPVTNKIYVANNFDGSVTVIDGATNTTTSVSVGASAWSIAVNAASNKIYVADYYGSTVTVIDGVTNNTTRVSTGSGPNAIVVNPATNNVYVANYFDNTVTVIDGTTNSTTTVSAGTNPIAVAVNTNTNTIYALNYSAGTVTVIDGTRNSTTTLSVGAYPCAVAVNLVTDKIYVYGSDVTVIDGATNTTSTVSVGASPAPGGYLGQSPVFPHAIAVNSVTNKVYIANTNALTVIDGATNTPSTIEDLSGTWPQAYGLFYEVAVNPVTNRVYVPVANASVLVIDGATNGASWVTVEAFPRGVAVNPVTNRIYVTNAQGNSVSVIEGSTNTQSTATVLPSSLNFPIQLVNTTSGALAVTVTNTGNAALNFTQVPSIGGASAADFAIATGTTCTSGTSVQPGDSCTIEITFTPLTTSFVSANLLIYDNATNSPQTVGLTGVVIAYATLGQIINGFPPQLILDNSAVVTDSYTIVYSPSVILYTVEWNSSSSMTSLYDAYKQYLPANGWTITNDISANPTSRGLYATKGASQLSVAILEQGTGSQVIEGYQVSYSQPSGPAPTISVVCPIQSTNTCSQLYFGSAPLSRGTATPLLPPYPQQKIVITNSGDAPLVFQAGTFNAETGDSSDFNIDAGNCTSNGSLGPGSNCSLSITFQPNGLSTRHSVLNILSNASNGQQSIDLSGLGTNVFYQFGFSLDDPLVPECFDVVPQSLGESGAGCAQMPVGFIGYSTKNYGCQLSSAASVLSTFDGFSSIGPGTLDSTSPTTPPTTCPMNAQDPSGKNCLYTPFGSGDIHFTPRYAEFPNFIEACDVSQDANGNDLIAACSSKNGNRLVDYLNDEISIQKNRVILVFREDIALKYYPTAQCAAGAHDVVTLGPDGNGDWSLFDPGWRVANSSTNYTLGAHKLGFDTSDSQGNLACRRVFTPIGVRTFGPAGPLKSLTVSAYSPVELLITDVQGHRLGNLGSLGDISEIPDGSYYREFALDDDAGDSGPVGDPSGIKTGFIPNPNDGTYTIVATGTGTGTYVLEIVAGNMDGSSQSVLSSGVTAPGATATYQATYSSIPGVPPQISRIATGPIASFSTSILTFGNQIIGTTSPTQNLTLTNTGDPALSIQGISASGDFAETNTCGAGIGVGQNCAISIVFKPSAIGTRTGVLTVTDNAAGSPHTVNLIGTATPGTPLITWPVPAPITYGTPLNLQQLDATANVPGSFAYNPPIGTVLNAGSQTLSVTFTPSDATDYSTAAAQVTLQVNQATPVIAWTPASVQLGYSLGATQLDANASVPGTFTYTPPSGTAIMTTSQTLSVLFTPTDTTDYTTASMSVPLTVTPGPLASVSPSSINFGTVYLGTITVKSVTVSNRGNAPMIITDPLLSIVSGGDSKEFVMANLCPKPLAAGKNCTIAVGFIAGPQYNPQTATIKVMDNAPGSPQTVNLTATVINPQVNFQPAILSFGTQSVNRSATKTVTLTNTGATALSITNIAITGTSTADFTQTSACPTSLAAGASCTISVTFKPLSKNTFGAGLTVTDNAFSGKQTVLLTGTGH